MSSSHAWGAVRERINEASTAADFTAVCIIVRARIRDGLEVDMQHLMRRGYRIIAVYSDAEHEHSRQRAWGSKDGVTVADVANVAGVIAAQIERTWAEEPRIRPVCEVCGEVEHHKDCVYRRP